VAGGVGLCVNFQNDANNCGWCGHSCQGTSCSFGVCGAITLGQTTYNSTITRAGGITLDGSNLYFSEYVTNVNNGYIETCPITGCPGTPATATQIFTDNGNAGLGQIIYDPGSTYLYWGDEGQSREYGITTSGTQIFEILGGDAVVNGLATDSTYLYFADYEGLAYVNKLSGGTVNRITSVLGYTSGVAVDPNTGNIWGAAANNNYIVSCTRAGSCSSWTWTGGPAFLAFIGSSPYVLTQSSGFYKCASNADCSQANATQLMTQTPSYSNFSYDSNYAYFPYTALVQRCSISAGCTSPQNIAQAAGVVAWTAVDSTWVYWITNNGYIQKVAK
jgi:hypothetical protein